MWIYPDSVPSTASPVSTTRTQSVMTPTMTPAEIPEISYTLPLNSRATVNVGIKKILLLYSSHLGPSVEDWVLVNNVTVVIYW